MLSISADNPEPISIILSSILDFSDVNLKSIV